MENEKLIKEALSYSLGSDLHEAWRAPRKLEDGTFESRMKKSKDEDWNKAHGTDDVDIANTSFKDLPSNWQYENLEAARVCIELVFDKVVNGEVITDDELIQMATKIHDEWLKRNNWVYDTQYGDPKLAVPFAELSADEQAKDVAQIEPAVRKVESYMRGELDINSIAEEYNLKQSTK